MNNDDWTANEWLTAIGCGAFAMGLWPVSAICGTALLARTTGKPVGNALATTAKGVGKGVAATAKGTKMMLTPKPKPPEIPTPPTKAEYAQNAGTKYEETCALIDSLPLDDDEKEAMKIHAKKQLINQMWGLLK